ncbi:MAG: monovalent cation/H(+) antiporter subunit G [Planctomycetota bacterium]
MTEMLHQGLTQSIGAAALAAEGVHQAELFPPIVFEILGAFFAVLGTLLSLLAAIGIARFPDVYTRMQASAKAGTLGVACLALAVPAHFASVGVFAEAMLVVVFFFLTAPVASHLIGRAAYIAGNPMWARTTIDELRGCYDHESHVLHAKPADASPRDKGYMPEASDGDSPPRHAAG